MLPSCVGLATIQISNKQMLVSSNTPLVPLFGLEEPLHANNQLKYHEHIKMRQTFTSSNDLKSNFGE